MTWVPGLDHPLVGRLELRYETLGVSGVEGQSLMAYHAEPGSASEQGLALLSSMVAEGEAQPAFKPADSTLGPSA